jgi:ABC-type glycerol-3-phosphate transport system permease component
MVTISELCKPPAALIFFIGEHRKEFGMVAASLVTVMIAVLIPYIFMSEKFRDGMTAGALKG